MSRPSFDDVYMNFAADLARRSTCDRLHVGCVVVSSDNQRMLSLGYNGGARGVFNECLTTEPGACGHLHAEVNALLKADYNDPARKKLYVTAAPCHSCSVAIVNAGISEVIYRDEYRSEAGLELLSRAGVIVRRYLDGSSCVPCRFPDTTDRDAAETGAAG